MSLVTAVKYLAEFAAEALKPWDPSREKAAVMLADLPLMVRLREDDVATADEVTYLVLGRFAAAEVPTIEGADWLPAGDCPSMFQDRNEPIYLYPCRRGKGHAGKHHSRDLLHSWTDTEQYDPSLVEVCTPPMGIANESPCLLAPMHAGLCEPPIPTDPNAEGADADVLPAVCPAEYTRPGGRQRGDRIVRCHLPSGHGGEHEEADTECTWLDGAS